MSKQKTAKRDIFAELMEGIGAIKQHREGKLTLRRHKLPFPRRDSYSTDESAPLAKQFSLDHMRSKPKKLANQRK